MTKFYAWVLAAAMAVAGFAGCTDEENDNNGEGTKEPTEQEGMPEYLYEGTAVVFSTMSPLMFGYFKVTGLRTWRRTMGGIGRRWSSNCSGLFPINFPI